MNELDDKLKAFEARMAKRTDEPQTWPRLTA